MFTHFAEPCWHCCNFHLLSIVQSAYYHSGGLRVNPNLYVDGKVCLSLLNTWTGRGNEVWDPSSSSILQVLVSLQGLVLNEKPYFNEAGYEKQVGTVEGEKNAVPYNENTYLLSLKSMLYILRRPPMVIQLPSWELYCINPLLHMVVIFFVAWYHIKKSNTSLILPDRLMLDHCSTLRILWRATSRSAVTASLKLVRHICKEMWLARSLMMLAPLTEARSTLAQLASSSH